MSDGNNSETPNHQQGCDTDLVGEYEPLLEVARRRKLQWSGPIPPGGQFIDCRPIWYDALFGGRCMRVRKATNNLVPQTLGPFKCYVTLFFWKFDPHPPPRNANNIEHYTLVTFFSRKSDTPPPPPSALRNTWNSWMTPLQSGRRLELQHVHVWARLKWRRG